MSKRAHRGSKKSWTDTKRKPDGGLLSRIMEASPAGITVVNRDGQITFANRRAEQILGLKKSEIVGRRYNSPKWRITTYDGQPYPNKDLPFQRVKATGKPVFDVRHAIQWPDGQSILLSINGAPLFDQSGRFDGMVAVVTNITSYVQSVSKLRESEERYRVLFEKSPIGIGTATLDGKVVSANEALQAITGYSEKELKKISLADMYENPEDRKRLLEVIRRRGSVANCLVRKKRKNGTTYEVVLNVSPIHAPSGDLLQTTCIDITESKRLQDELEKSKRFLEEVMDAIPDLLFIRGKDLKYAYVNKAVSDFFGKPKRELLGKTAYDLYPRQAASENQRTDMEVLEKGIQIDRPELTARDKNGAEHVLQARKAPLRDDEGNVTHVIAVSRDITGRRKAEEAVRRSEEEFRSLMEDAPIGLCNTDLKGTVTFVNKRFEEASGYSRDEVVGKSGFELGMFDSATLKLFAERIKNKLKGKQTRSFDTRFKCKDGRWIWVEVEGRVIKKWGIPVGFQITSRNITDRKQMEEEIRSLARFPLENPNPILRMSRDGVVLDTNPASEELLHSWGSMVGGKAPKTWIDLVTKAFESQSPRSFDAELGDKAYLFTVVPVKDADYVNVYGRDVTDRKRMEKELRTRAQELQTQNMKLREAEALGKIGNWEYHVDSQRIVWSEGTYALYERDPALGPPTAEEEAEYYPADQAKMLRDYAARSIKNEQEFRYDLEAILPSGRKLFTASMSPVRDETGRVVRLFGTVQDITERKRMEEELRRHTEHLEELVEERTKRLHESEEKYRSLVMNIPDVVWTCDQDGNTLFISPSIERIQGSTPEEVYKSGSGFWFEVIHPDDIERVRKAYTSLFTEGQMFDVEYRIGREDRNWVWLRDRSLGTYEKDGISCADGVFSDITGRKRMELQLEESEERFRGIAERSFDMIITLDLDGRIRYTSPAVMWITGYSQEEMLGQHFQSYLPEEDVAKEMEAFMEAARGKIVRTQPLKIRRKDGSIVHIEVNASPMFSSQKIVGIQAIARDVTERFTLAEMRERFISTVTHELRTPLASIKGYLDLILAEAPGAVSGEIESSLQVVKRNADRLLSLTNDLLDIQRMTAGRLQLSMGAVNLKKIIEQSNADILPIVTERKQNLVLEVPDELPEIHGDPVRLGQVFSNLLSNASKFSPEGGNITLRVKEEKDTIRTQVSDSGIGIKKEDLAHIFEPFTTVQKPSYIRGTGLGLSITKGILEAHGGKIWAESQGEGKGATFTFTLPKPERED